MSKKRKSKIKLPVDRDGKPINVGCIVEFEEGVTPIYSLTYYGDDLGWVANEVGTTDAPEEFEGIDNLEGGIVVWRGKAI